MAAASRFTNAFYDPENQNDTEILLSSLDDDELEKECEKILDHLGQFSDNEDDSDQEIGTPLDEIPVIPRVVGSNIEPIHEPIIVLPEAEQNERSKEMEIKKKSDINWKKGSFLKYEFVTENIQKENDENFQDNLVPYPIEYFLRYLPDDIFLKMSEMTNIYVLQQGKTFKACNSEEIKSIFGLHIMMSCLRYPRVRMYWDKTLRQSFFYDTMSRDRFFQLRTNLHVVNNLERPAGNDDRMYKARPLFDSIRKRCLELEMEKNMCVDVSLFC